MTRDPQYLQIGIRTGLVTGELIYDHVKIHLQGCQSVRQFLAPLPPGCTLTVLS